MKTSKYLGLLLFLFFAINCKKNDDTVIVEPVVIDKPNPEPEPENQAPGNFDLLEVMDGATDTDLMPSFSWNTATDPDGDPVGYDLFLFKEGADVLPESKIAADLNTTLFESENRISLVTDYNWHVVAKDDKGKETTSSTFTFTTRNLNNPETPANDNAGFSPRLLHTVTFFKDKLWLIGGADKDEIKSDILQSTNGIDWNDQNGEIQTTLRGHSSLVFKDTLWVLGGRTSKETNTRQNLMLAGIGFNSFDDAFNAPWTAREMHTSAVFQDKVWILGGIDNANNPLNDVWSTTDVASWDPNGKTTANWHGRFGHSSVVFDDKLWVIGGYDGNNYLNEVWYTDGTTLSNGDLKWEFVPQQNGFPGRISHQTVVYDNKIWLVGGNDGSGGAKNDVWYSEDGANWVPLTQDANFTGRIRPTLTAFDSKLFMIGGYDGSDYHNEVWVFD